MEKYKLLLSAKLKETQGRHTYNGTEVRDMLLDLWLELKADFPEIALEEELGEELVPTG